MKISIPNRLNENVRSAMRRCSYFEIYDRRSGHFSYARNLGRGHYPRFHIYVDESLDQLVFNLHIDQKEVSYEGHNSHSGEYDSEVVQAEGDRIRNILESMMTTEGCKYEEEEEDEKGFFGKLFG